LVVRGCNQKKGIDFNEIFYRFGCYIFVGALISFRDVFNLEFKQLDVKTTLLHCELAKKSFIGGNPMVL